MSAPATSALERAARESWLRWGDGYALYTACGACGNVRHCRGQIREAMLCLECHDLGLKPTRGAA